ncbi:uncharacterized protein LOC135813756 isoform X2 [Sycon ciliatum]|uniref:uncharacterized protein LOC135813756 isoform X2 n=1 Tax=Sycon ciliatum TaxID=27933 RepID=UPI0031F66D4B
MENLSSLKDVLVDEVALSGLEGISLEVLWRRLQTRQSFQAATDDTLYPYAWRVLVEKCGDINFYARQTPFQDVFVVGNLNPLKTVKEYFGYSPKDPYTPVNDKEKGVRGLCATYKTREDVTDVVRCVSTDKTLCSYTEAVEKYGEKLVMVASQKLRERALWGRSDSLAPVNDRQYCILEVIGRARSQGVTQRAIHSYLKLDPRSCFYDVRMLAKYKFITMQPYVNSPNERPGRVKTPMLLLPRFDHLVFSPLDVAGELMSRYLEAQPGCCIKYADHQWPSQIHPFLAQSCYYQLLLDGYWQVENPVEKPSLRRKSRAKTPKSLKKESLEQKIAARDGTGAASKLFERGVEVKLEDGDGDGDEGYNADGTEQLKPDSALSVPSTPTGKRKARGKRGSASSTPASTLTTPASTAASAGKDSTVSATSATAASPSAMAAGSDGTATPLDAASVGNSPSKEDAKQLEQQRRLLRKPYNRPTAGSVVSLLKSFRAATSPWVHGKEKVADAAEDDEDGVVPTNAGESSIELPLGQHIYWFVENTGSDGALLADVCDSLVYKHDRHIKKKIQKKTTERHWGWIDAMLKDMGRVRKHVLVAKEHKAGNADMVLIDAVSKKTSHKQLSVLPDGFSPSVTSSSQATPKKTTSKSAECLKIEASASPVLPLYPPSSSVSTGVCVGGVAISSSSNNTTDNPIPIITTSTDGDASAADTGADTANVDTKLAMNVANKPLDPQLLQSYLTPGTPSEDSLPQSPSSDPTAATSNLLQTPGAQSGASTAHESSLSQTPISVELQEMKKKQTTTASKRMVTALQLKRQQMLLDYINKEEVVLTNQAVMYGLQNDHAVKLSDQQVACRKTVVRAMQVLAEKGLVQCVKTSTEAPSGNQTSVIAWVSNALDVKSEEVPRRLRLLLPMTREDPLNELHGEREKKKKRSHKKKPSNSMLASDLNYADGDAVDGAMSDASEKVGEELADDEDAESSPASTELLLYSKHQKMQRLRIFHIYLFRLMFGRAGDLKGPNSDTELSSVVNQFPWLENVHIAADTTSTPGTMNCYDALVNMPFAVYFTLIGSIEQSPKCVQYLHKPEYTYKPLKHLPRFLFEEALCFNKRHTEAFRGVTSLLQLLEVMKLVKLNDENKMLKAREFTLLTTATLVDTTLVASGGYMLLDPELTKTLPVCNYQLCDIFSTIRFWYSVEDICRRTPLGSLHMKDNDDALKERLKADGVEIVHHFYSRENHSFPRICIGAAGYPPDFFAHRFWLLNWERKDRRLPQLRGDSANVTQDTESQNELFDSLTADDLEGLDPAILKEILKDDTPARTPRTRSRSNRLSSLSTVTGKAASPSQGGRGLKRSRQGGTDSPSKRAKKSAGTGAASAGGAGRGTGRGGTKDTDHINGGDGGSGGVDNATPSPRPSFLSKASSVAAAPAVPQRMTANAFAKLPMSEFKLHMEVASTGLPTKKGTSAEPEDIEAVSRMVKLRIAYSPAEDQYVLCHHVAICYLRTLGLEEATWSQCRDGIHKAIEESRDKSSGSLFRRARYLAKRQTVIRDCRVALLQVLQTLQTAVQRGGKLPETYDEVFPIILQQDKNRPQGAPKLTDTVVELYDRYNVLDIDRQMNETYVWDDKAEEDAQLCVIADVIQTTTKAAMSEESFDSLDAFSTLEGFNSKLLEAVFQRFQASHLLKRMRYKEKSEYKRIHGHFPHAFNGYILTPGYFDLFEVRNQPTSGLANGRQLYQLLKTHGYISLNVTVQESMFNACGVSGEKTVTRNLAPARKRRLAAGTQSTAGRKALEGASDDSDLASADEDTDVPPPPPSKRRRTGSRRPLEQPGDGKAEAVVLVAADDAPLLSDIASGLTKQSVCKTAAAVDASLPGGHSVSTGQEHGSSTNAAAAADDAELDTSDSVKNAGDGLESADVVSATPVPSVLPATTSATSTTTVTNLTTPAAATPAAAAAAAGGGGAGGAGGAGGGGATDVLDVESDAEGNESDVSDIEDFDAIAANSQKVITKEVDTSRPTLNEDDLRIGAFHCIGSLLASDKLAIDGYLPSKSINQKASAVGALGEEKVWRGLAYNVLEAVQGTTTDTSAAAASTASASSSTPQASMGNKAVSSKTTSSAGTAASTQSAAEKKSVSFGFDSDADSSGDEGIGSSLIATSSTRTTGNATAAAASSTTASASAGGGGGGDGEQGDVSVGLTRVLGLSDTNVALKPCSIELYSLKDEHLINLTVDCENATLDDGESQDTLSCWQLRKFVRATDCQRVRLKSSEPLLTEHLDPDELYSLFDTEESREEDMDDTDDVVGDSLAERYRRSSLPSASITPLSLAEYQNLCADYLQWSDADISAAKMLFDQIEECGWQGMSLATIHKIKFDGNCQLSIMDHLQYLVNFQLVLLAGVKESGAVATVNAKCWMVQSSVTSRIPVSQSTEIMAVKTEMPAAAAADPSTSSVKLASSVVDTAEANGGVADVQTGESGTALDHATTAAAAAAAASNVGQDGSVSVSDTGIVSSTGEASRSTAANANTLTSSTGATGSPSKYKQGQQVPSTPKSSSSTKGTATPADAGSASDPLASSQGSARAQDSAEMPTLLQKFNKTPPARRRSVHLDLHTVASVPTVHTSKPRQLNFASRPWLSSEGVTMEGSAEQMLYGVARLIMSQPGIKKSRLHELFADVFRPTVVNQLLENLCNSGLVEERVVEICEKPSLFSKPTVYTPAGGRFSTDCSPRQTYYVPTINCMAQLSQL